MASNRHLGRIVVLQSLYEYEFRTKAGDASTDIDLIVAKNIIPYEKALGDIEFVYDLAHKIVDNADSLDEALRPLAPEWPIETISTIDRNVLRIGLYELSECHDKVPPKVSINEAVELAKAFGSENSSKFVNGVLGTAYRKIFSDDSKEGNHGSKITEEAKAPSDSEKTSSKETSSTDSAKTDSQGAGSTSD